MYQLKDYLYSINQSKKNILVDDIDAEKKYPTYIINRCLSSFTDTVLFANEMNKNPHLPKRLQYDFYINSVKPRKRFSPCNCVDCSGLILKSTTVHLECNGSIILLIKLHVNIKRQLL